MSNLIPFDFDSHAIRVLIKDDAPWFCLTDVCRALDVDRSSNLVKSLDPKGWVSNLTLTGGGSQSLAFIHEPNLYRLIFRSDKPEARRFQDWVFNEVLPAVRQTGEYRTTPDPLSVDIARLQSQLAACHTELLKVHPLWRKVTRYRRMGLNHAEVGLLVDRSRTCASRQAHRLEACGILTPPESAQLSLLEG